MKGVADMACRPPLCQHILLSLDMCRPRSHCLLEVLQAHFAGTSSGGHVEHATAVFRYGDIHA